MKRSKRTSKKILKGGESCTPENPGDFCRFVRNSIIGGNENVCASITVVDENSIAASKRILDIAVKNENINIEYFKQNMNCFYDILSKKDENNINSESTFELINRIYGKAYDPSAEEAEEEEAARLAAEEESARLAAEEESARLAAEEESARLAAAEESARLAAAEESARLAAAEESARLAAKESARLAAEELRRNTIVKPNLTKRELEKIKKENEIRKTKYEKEQQQLAAKILANNQRAQELRDINMNKPQGGKVSQKKRSKPNTTKKSKK